MPFTTARTHLQSGDRAILDELIAEWDGAGDHSRQAAENLRHEHGAANAPITAYLAVLARNRRALSPAMRGHQNTFDTIGGVFALQGHRALKFKNALFGRAILLEKYIRRLKPTLHSMGQFDEPSEIERNMRRFDNNVETMLPADLHPYLEAIRRTALGRGAIFATFARRMPGTMRPWRPPLDTARAVRDAIALGGDDSGKDYILFVYRLPNGVEPRVPTTPSPGWHYQQWFRPNRRAYTERHGWTAPLDPVRQPQREIVHSGIDGTTIVLPLHIAT